MKRNTMRSGYAGKLMKMMMTALLISLLFATAAFAAAGIKKAEYEGKGRVDVSFNSKVTYNDVKVTVTNENGSDEACRIIEKDDDDLEFKINNYKPGTRYNFTISGVAKKGETDYGSVSGSVKIPKAPGGIPLKEIDYDAKDKEVSFDFDTKVQWKSPKVTIKKDGKNYVKKIKDKDKDDIEVSVKKLKKGEKYTYTIKGIRKKGTKEYIKISGSFTP